MGSAHGEARGSSSRSASGWWLVAGLAAAAGLSVLIFLLVRATESNPADTLRPTQQTGFAQGPQLMLDGEKRPDLAVEGASVITKNSARFTARGMMVDMGPRTILEIKQVDRAQIGSRLTLHQGYIDCSVDQNKTTGPIVIETADTQVEVTGTQFMVRYDEKLGTEVRVSKGEVVLNSGGRRQTLASGERFVSLQPASWAWRAEGVQLRQSET